MSSHRPTPSPRRRPGVRHVLVTLGSVLLLAATIVVGAIASPSDAASTARTEAATIDLPLTTSAVPTQRTTESVRLTGPESGPLLTAETWRLAIGSAVVGAGATRLGAPYVYSAGGPDAFDCSGFVRWAWLQLGVTLPHNSVAMWDAVERIPLDQLQPGDIVFDSLGGPPEHVGLYVGDGLMIHAPSSGNVVRYDRVGWWTGATVTAGRVRAAI